MKKSILIILSVVLISCTGSKDIVQETNIIPDSNTVPVNNSDPLNIDDAQVAQPTSGSEVSKGQF